MHAERVRGDTDPSLLVDVLHGLLGSEELRHLLVEPQAYDLAPVGHDLITDDDVYIAVFSRILLGDEGAGHLVMVGYTEYIQSSLTGSVDLGLRRADGFGEPEGSEHLESGIIRMEMRVDLTHLIHVLTVDWHII